MPTLHDIIPEALASLARRLPEPTAERKATARAARASAGRRRLDTRLLTGALTAGLMTAAAFPSIVAFNPWDDEVVATPGEFRFAPGAETRWGYTLSDERGWCGKEAPAVMTSAAGFALEATPGRASGGAPPWTTKLLYAGPDRYAFVGQGVGLILRDGLVVGVQYDYSGVSNELRTFADGTTASAGVATGDVSQIGWCALESSSLDASDAAIEAGTYQVMWAVHIYMTARDAAVAALREQALAVAAPSPVYPDDYPDDYRFTYDWQPGSVDCLTAEAQSAYGLELPVQCLSVLPDFVTAEPGTGALVVSYDPDVVGEPVDVVLASEPVTFTVPTTVTLGDLGWYDSGPTPQPAPLACGADAQEYQSTASFPQSLARGALMSDALAGKRVPLELDYQPVRHESDASVDLPDGEQVWIASGYRNYGDTDAMRFMATATLHFSQNPATLHRATGYPDIDVWLTDVSLCPGVSADDDFMTSTGAWLYSPRDVTVTWDGGRVQTFPQLMITESQYNW